MNIKLSIFTSFALLILIVYPNYSSTQLDSPGIPTDKDTSIVFSPAIDIFQNVMIEYNKVNYAGFNLAFSDHGLGFGASYLYTVSNTISVNAQFIISGAHNSDEIELWDYEYYDYRVPNKVNRLYMLPASIGLKYRLFPNALSNKLRPFVEAGGGATWIIATPYDIEFFSAFSKAKNYIRPLAYITLGIDIFSGTSPITFSAKYLYIPFGGNGLESILNKPIYNFGGIFLEISAKIPLK